MSWFFGLILKDKNSSEIIEKVGKIHSTALFSHQKRDFYVLCGGFEKTLILKIPIRDGLFAEREL